MPHIAAQLDGNLQRGTSWPYKGIHLLKLFLLTSDCYDATYQSWLNWFIHFPQLCWQDAQYSFALHT